MVGNTSLSLFIEAFLCQKSDSHLARLARMAQSVKSTTHPMQINNRISDPMVNLPIQMGLNEIICIIEGEVNSAIDIYVKDFGDNSREPLVSCCTKERSKKQSWMISPSCNRREGERCNGI